MGPSIRLSQVQALRGSLCHMLHARGSLGYLRPGHGTPLTDFSLVRIADATDAGQQARFSIPRIVALQDLSTLAAQEHNTVSLGDLVSQTFTGFWLSSPPTPFCLCLPSEADNSEDRSMADVLRQAARVPPPPPPPVRKPTVQEKRVKQIRKKDGKSRDCKEPFPYESHARSAPHPPPGSTCVNELLHGRACPRTRLCAISASHVGLGIVRPRFTTHFTCSCDVHLGLAGGFLLHVLALRNPQSVTVP